MLRPLPQFPSLLLLLLYLVPAAFGDTAFRISASANSTSNMPPGASVPTGLSESAEAASPRQGPGAVPFDVEGYPAAPTGLTLEQVHVYVRHGERTPVRIRMSDPPASIPASWTLCHTARRFGAAVARSATLGLDGDESGTMPLRKVVERADGSVHTGECLLGELTDVGRQTTYDFGSALRRLYVDRLGFLPNTLQSDSQAYFRSTNVPRTVESLYQVMHGLYPSETCAPGYTPAVRIRNAVHENLFANTGACKRLEILEVAFARAAIASWNEKLEPLDKKISKYIGGNPIRLDGRPHASGILDTVRAAVANNVTVPKELTEEGVIDVVEKAVIAEWFGGYSTDEVRRLSMGRLLSDVSTKMQQKARSGDADSMRILVHGTHDTTLAGICASLDVFDDRWPAFTSYVTFELFRKQDPPGLAHTSPWQTILAPFTTPNISDHYVRMRYQNKNMVLPLCAPEGKHLPGHPEFCTLKAFRDRVNELTPVNWEAECSPSVGKT